jgi:hypothetical protein
MSTHTTRSFLGRNNQAIDSRYQTFGYEKTKAIVRRRLGDAIEIEVDSHEPEEVMMVEVTWMQLYLAYMLNKALPEDVVEARRIMLRSKAFVVVKEELYKKSISGVLQRYVTPQEGQAILHDIHAGVHDHHASSRAIAAKVFRASFNWLTGVEDAKDIVRRCEACQRFASMPHAPAAELWLIPLS